MSFIPTTVTQIDETCFQNSSLSEIVFTTPSSIQIIKESIFAYSSSLFSIQLPVFSSSILDVSSNFLNGSSIERIEVYRDRALGLLPMLKPKMRYSPAIMMGLYRSILKKINRVNGDVFTERIRLNKAEKITLALSLYIRHRFLTFF